MSDKEFMEKAPDWPHPHKDPVLGELAPEPRLLARRITELENKVSAVEAVQEGAQNRLLDLEQDFREFKRLMEDIRVAGLKDPCVGCRKISTCDLYHDAKRAMCSTYRIRMGLDPFMRLPGW